MSRNTILTVGGEYFDFNSPESCRFDIEDIAHALSNICRYTGHSRTFYSVAQHSVIVSNIVAPPYALAGLLHDAAEAFIGDVAKPLKNLLPDYQAIEKRVEAAVFTRFNLDPELPRAVKIADLIALRTEQRDLMDADDHYWSDSYNYEPLPDRIVPWTSRESYLLFMERFQQLTEVRHNGFAPVDSIQVSHPSCQECRLRVSSCK